METTFIVLAGVLGALGVGLGAFGAHGLKPYFEQHPELEPTFKTAVQYHMYHVPALIGAAWVWNYGENNLSMVAGWLFVAGILVFSGSLYLLVMTRKRWLGAITPLGGLALIAGWVLLAASVL